MRMARNSEKQFGKLNRLILQKEKEELLEKQPKRPKLSQLHSTNEIKKWLPSIKKDIEFNLTQSQVVCYSDTKVAELQNEVTRLEKEYKCFVHKLRCLDPTITQTPWTNRPYERKTAVPPKRNLTKEISTPILDHIEPTNSNEIKIINYNEALLDVPLSFSATFQPPKKQKLNSIRETNEQFEAQYGESVRTRTEQLQKLFGLTASTSDNQVNQKSGIKSMKNSVLGLIYSSSEDET